MTQTYNLFFHILYYFCYYYENTSQEVLNCYIAFMYSKCFTYCQYKNPNGQYAHGIWPILVLHVSRLLCTAHVSEVISSTVGNVLIIKVFIDDNIKCTLLRIVLTRWCTVKTNINNEFIIFLILNRYKCIYVGKNLSAQNIFCL